MLMKTTPSNPALKVEGLVVAYGDKPALTGVDAVFPAGVMSAIIGPNGAGKSTLLQAVMGMVEPAAGTIRFFGEPLRTARSRIAYVPQRASVDWDFPATALDVVLMGLYQKIGALRFIGRPEREKALACLREVGLEDYAGRQIGQLSGGQQQRVFVARALAQDADLLILDEPLAGVDAATEQTIVALLKALVSAGRTAICVHHDLSTVAGYYDHVLVINMRTIASGPTRTAFTKDNLDRAYGGRLAGWSEPAAAGTSDAGVAGFGTAM